MFRCTTWFRPRLHPVAQPYEAAGKEAPKTKFRVYEIAGGGRRLQWKEKSSRGRRVDSDRMLPPRHVLLWAENAVSSPVATTANIAADRGQRFDFAASARIAPLFRSSVMEITGNKNAIRHASAMASATRRLLAGGGLSQTLERTTSPAERTNHAILSASSKSVLAFFKMPLFPQQMCQELASVWDYA